MMREFTDLAEDGIVAEIQIQHNGSVIGDIPALIGIG